MTPGTVYPREAPRPTRSTAERLVYSALQTHLPAGWVAWHSLRLRVGAEWEGEGDFVIACPERGFVVVEVKGGQMSLSNGIWHQNGRPLTKPPRAQALGVAQKLAAEIATARAELRVPYAAACIFPETEFSDGPEAGDLRGAVLGARDLQWFDRALEELCDRLLRRAPVPQFGWWRHRIHELWGDNWTGHVRLRDRVSDSVEKTFALDAEQLRILDAAQANPRVWVTGGAGTGKTVVAREYARRLAREGRKVLYLCFTDALGFAIDDYFSHARTAGADLRAAPIRRFARTLLDDAGAPRPPAEDESYWEQVSLQAASDALPAGAERPEIVVVDEAQDLTAADWILVGELATEGVPLWIFGDDRQRFWPDRAVPESISHGMTRLGLSVQKRSPESIARLAEAYVAAAAPAPAAAVADGNPGARIARCEEIRVVQAKAADRLVPALGDAVHRLLKDGAAPKDIAVLSLAGRSHARTMDLERLGETPALRADNPAAAGALVTDTFLRFRGLERPFIVVTDLPGDCARELSNADVRMHIALTRATLGVTIVGTQDALRRESRLAALLA